MKVIKSEEQWQNYLKNENLAIKQKYESVIYDTKHLGYYYLLKF